MRSCFLLNLQFFGGNGLVQQKLAGSADDSVR